MKTIVLIPTYNEKENIEALLREILSCTPDSLECLVIDDQSPDGTGQIADAIAAKESRVHVLHREKKEGLRKAYVSGFQWGLDHGFDVMIQMDADFSHHPKYLVDHLEKMKDHDLCIGSRYVKGGGTKNWGLLRLFISRGGSIYSRVILGIPINDYQAGFNSWRRSVVEKIGIHSLTSEGYAFQIELKYRAFLMGAKITETPIVFEDRVQGKSKMSTKIVLEALWKVLQFRLTSHSFKGLLESKNGTSS